MPKLIVSDENGHVCDIALGPEHIRMGRASDNELVIDDHKASRYHAEIKLVDGKYIVYDKESKNGTRVNGVLLKAKTLGENDRITIGRTSILFQGGSTDEINLTEEGIGDNVIKSSLEDFSSATMIFSDVESIKKTGLERRPVSQIEKDQQMLMMMYQISKDLISVVELNDLLDKLMDYVFKITRADRGFLMRIRESNGELVPMIARHREMDGDIKITISRTMAREVIDKKVSILTSDASLDDRFSGQESIIMHNTRSAMCVPLWSHKGVIGLLYVDYTHTLEHFTKDDLHLLTAFANLAAIGMEHTNLIRKIREEEVQKTTLTRFFSPNLVSEIMKKRTSSRLKKR